MWPFPSWDSLEEIQKFSGRLTWLVVTAGALLAAAGILQRIYDVRADKLQDAEDEKKDKRLVAAETKATQLEEQLAPRVLTNDQIARLIEELRATNGARTIHILNVGTDPEAIALFNQFVHVFTNAGWTVNTTSHLLSGNTRRGAGLFFNPDKYDNNDLQSLLSALERAGCP